LVVGENRGRGADNAGGKAVPTGVKTGATPALLVGGGALGAAEGTVVGTTGDADVPDDAAGVPPAVVVASAAVGDDRTVGIRVPVPVARTLGLGVRKSYERGPTR
jgi:hypothetical protein